MKFTDMLPRPEKPSGNALAFSCAIASLGFALTGFSMLWIVGYPLALFGLFGIYLALAPNTLIAHGVSAGGALAMGKAMSALVELLGALLSTPRGGVVGAAISTGIWFLVAPTVVARAITFRSGDNGLSVDRVYYTALMSAGATLGLYLFLRMLGVPASP